MGEISEVIGQAPANSVEYKIYNGLGTELSNSELSRRIDWLQLRESSRTFDTTYKKAVIFYLQAELVQRRQNNFKPKRP